LNYTGVRVDSRKTRGLFSKMVRLKRYALIRVVGSGSSGTEQRGWGSGTGGGDCSPEVTPPWRRLAGDGLSRPSGPHLARGQALEKARGTVNPTGRPGRWIGVGSRLSTAEAALGRATAARRARSRRGREGEGARCDPYHPGGSGVKSWRRKVDRRRSRAALAEEGDAEVAGPSGSRGSIREPPAVWK
jgi:hypothetical protein